MTDRRSSSRIRYAGGVLPPPARVRPGRDVTVVELSQTGALVESLHRFKPGSLVEVSLHLNDGPCTVRGRIARCFVVSITRGALVRYRAGIQFESAVRVEAPVDPLAQFGAWRLGGHAASRG